MNTSTAWSIDELLTVAAARELAGKSVVFAGIGLPTLAVSLAQETTSPNIQVIYESGVCGAHPSALPATIADSDLITDSEAVLNLASLFGYVLQGGRSASHSRALRFTRTMSLVRPSPVRTRLHA